jgi:hypothetical protein
VLPQSGHIGRFCPPRTPGSFGCSVTSSPDAAHRHHRGIPSEDPLGVTRWRLA